jgi:hypothetical protein
MGVFFGISPNESVLPWNVCMLSTRIAAIVCSQSTSIKDTVVGNETDKKVTSGIQEISHLRKKMTVVMSMMHASPAFGGKARRAMAQFSFEMTPMTTWP